MKTIKLNESQLKAMIKEIIAEQKSEINNINQIETETSQKFVSELVSAFGDIIIPENSGVQESMVYIKVKNQPYTYIYDILTEKYKTNNQTIKLYPQITTQFKRFIDYYFSRNPFGLKYKRTITKST
jgi:hypothetical protein